MVKFSIILPVKNGGEFIKECVHSILKQSFTGFNLLVLDNNSTDGTLEWIQSIDDSRIEIYPTGNPLSIEQNWGRITSIPKNEFITIIGHDDILNSYYLATMNDLILKFPDAILYQTHFKYINGDGKLIRPCKPMAEKEFANEFLEKYLKKEIDVMGTGFMVRAADYDRIGGIPDYPNLLFADFELWINLTKWGYKATSMAECFSFRIHQSTTTTSADIKYNKAFERFISYLVKLKNENSEFASIINRYGNGFLLFYCRAFSHRLLRASKKDRIELSVKSNITTFKKYAASLGLADYFHPEKKIGIRLAAFIDSTVLGRKGFLLFKKIFKKPVMN